MHVMYEVDPSIAQPTQKFLSVYTQKSPPKLGLRFNQIVCMPKIIGSKNANGNIMESANISTRLMAKEGKKIATQQRKPKRRMRRNGREKHEMSIKLYVFHLQ